MSQKIKIINSLGKCPVCTATCTTFICNTSIQFRHCSSAGWVWWEREVHACIFDLTQYSKEYFKQDFCLLVREDAQTSLQYMWVGFNRPCEGQMASFIKFWVHPYIIAYCSLGKLAVVCMVSLCQRSCFLSLSLGFSSFISDSTS